MSCPLKPASQPEDPPAAPPSPQRASVSSTDSHRVTQSPRASVNVPAAAGTPPSPADAETHDSTRLHGVPSAITRKLYLSHFLSTWNSRSFEFGAVLFLASIFPATLLPLSIYALVRCAAAICLAPLIGRAIDRRRRLPVVRFSIVAGRAAVIASCIGFWGLDTYTSVSSSARWAIFGALTLLSCVEKPCSVLNLVAVERDWIVVIAGDDRPTLQGTLLVRSSSCRARPSNQATQDLRMLIPSDTAISARARRIDLFCKLAGPLFIALIDGASTRTAILLTLGINAVSLPIEYAAIAQVHNAVPLLQRPRTPPSPAADADGPGPTPPRSIKSVAPRLYALFDTFRSYYRHTAFLPSFALSLLYLTVLSLGGQMVTYLLSAGYSPFHIGLVRTLSVVFELSATWIAPRLMQRIDPARAAMWFLSWQMVWLGAAVSFFWAAAKPTSSSSIIAASGLVAGTILSRVGLWGYDLCAQFIIQEEVQDGHRGSFSATEASFQNAFELLAYASTVLWLRPDQFRNPVLLSAGAVYLAAFLFGIFLRRRRGHLVHVPACIECKDSLRDDEDEEDEHQRVMV